jgi:hypothetical protein
VTQLVLDRNVIRREILSEAATNRENEFVLTDTFLVEMVKHPEQWAETVRKDLAVIRPLGDRIWLSISVGEALRTELSRHGVPPAARRAYASLR